MRRVANAPEGEAYHRKYANAGYCGVSFKPWGQPHLLLPTRSPPGYINEVNLLKLHGNLLNLPLARYCRIVGFSNRFI